MADITWTGSATIRFNTYCRDRSLNEDQSIAFFNRITKSVKTLAMSTVGIVDVDRVNSCDKVTVEQNTARIKRIQSMVQQIDALIPNFNTLYPNPANPGLIEDLAELKVEGLCEIDDLAKQQRELVGNGPGSLENVL